MSFCLWSIYLSMPKSPQHGRNMLLSCSVDDSGLMLHFFGKEGEKKLDLAAFNGFLTGLHAEIDRLEFQYYDPQDTASPCGVAAKCLM